MMMVKTAELMIIGDTRNVVTVVAQSWIYLYREVIIISETRAI